MSTELTQQQIEQAKQEDVAVIRDILLGTDPPLPLTLPNALTVLRRGLARKPEAWTVTETELEGYWERVTERVVA